jgi:adenine-specific DNA-methyltransferase
MFKNASIDILIFRYCKNNLIEKKVLYNEKLLYIINSDGLITFEENENINNVIFSEYFDIYVGIVSGKDLVYKNEELGNIQVLNGKDKLEKYILINEYPCVDEDRNNHLLKYKTDLINRKIRKFNNENWFQWGALRNIKSITNNIDKECIYIYNLTRQKNVAFIGKVQYFGGNLIMLIPKKKINLYNILLYINSNKFKNNFIYSSRFIIGHRQLSNSLIPKKYIDDIDIIESLELLNI